MIIPPHRHIHTQTHRQHATPATTTPITIIIICAATTPISFLPPPQRYVSTHPFIAGALTGGLEILITFPLEFIKVQLQLKHHYQLSAFSGPVDCALYTMRTKGPLGLYKGLSPWLIFAFPRSAVRFSTYEYASHALQGDGLKLEPVYAMLAGTLAGSSKCFGNKTGGRGGGGIVCKICGMEGIEK